MVVRGAGGVVTMGRGRGAVNAGVFDSEVGAGRTLMLIGDRGSRLPFSDETMAPDRLAVDNRFPQERLEGGSAPTCLTPDLGVRLPG